MRKLRAILITTLAFCICGYALAAAPKWETVEAASAANAIAETEKLEVAAADGYIYIYAPEAVNVKVLSIVGQLICEQQVPAGVSRLKISARGIYLVKAGDTTLRVTI